MQMLQEQRVALQDILNAKEKRARLQQSKRCIGGSKLHCPQNKSGRLG